MSRVAVWSAPLGGVIALAALAVTLLPGTVAWTWSGGGLLVGLGALALAPRLPMEPGIPRGEPSARGLVARRWLGWLAAAGLAASVVHGVLWVLGRGGLSGLILGVVAAVMAGAIRVHVAGAFPHPGIDYE